MFSKLFSNKIHIEPTKSDSVRTAELTEEEIRQRTIDHANFSYEFNEKNLHRKKVDLAAKLICTRNTDRHWELCLTEITGVNVDYLLGRTFDLAEKVQLDSLIPEEKRAQHYGHVEKVLNKGINSELWDFLFETMLDRTVTIVNPHDKTPRHVDVAMTADENLCMDGKSYVFYISMMDQTASRLAATKAGALTHDLRSCLRGIINIVTDDSSTSECDLPGLSSDALAAKSRDELIQLVVTYQAQQHQKCERLVEMAQQGMVLCSASHDDFVPQSIRNETVKTASPGSYTLVPVNEKLHHFIGELRANLSQIQQGQGQLYLFDNSGLALMSKTMGLMEQFLLNLIKNAFEAKASQVDVTCSSSFFNETDELQCDVTDNGPGIPEPLLANFFTRALPVKRDICPHSRSIEDKRGEGTLLAYEVWRSQGGSATVSARHNGQSGTTFQLKIPAHPLRFFTDQGSESSNILSQEQLSNLNILAKNHDLRGIILLADDQLFNLKILMRQIFTTLFPGVPQPKTELSDLKQDVWNEHGLTIDILGEWGIVCAANGDIAYAAVKNCPVTATITDQQMPGKRQGTDLIISIREMEQKDIRAPMHIALNTGLDSNTINIKSPEVLNHLDVVYILKSADKAVLNAFFSSIGLGMKEFDVALTLKSANFS